MPDSAYRSGDDTFLDAARLMSRADIGFVPVARGNKLIGTRARSDETKSAGAALDGIERPS